jgi:hypothetical protein
MAAQARWEYWSGILWSESLRKPKEGEEQLARYSPQRLIPALDAMGDEGWELVHMEPVVVGNNEDVLLLDNTGNRAWTHAYFCVFKRPRQF